MQLLSKVVLLYLYRSMIQTNFNIPNKVANDLVNLHNGAGRPIVHAHKRNSFYSNIYNRNSQLSELRYKSCITQLKTKLKLLRNSNYLDRDLQNIITSSRALGTNALPSVIIVYRKSTHFCLLGKRFYNECL